MELKKGLSLAHALAELTADEANTVIAIADEFRGLKATPEAKPKKSWRKKAAEKAAKAAAGDTTDGAKRRGRPKGVKNKPKEEAAAAVEPEVSEYTEPVEAEAKH